jgi:hypothetical protein
VAMAVRRRWPPATSADASAGSRHLPHSDVTGCHMTAKRCGKPVLLDASAALRVDAGRAQG